MENGSLAGWVFWGGLGVLIYSSLAGLTKMVLLSLPKSIRQRLHYTKPLRFEVVALLWPVWLLFLILGCAVFYWVRGVGGDESRPD